MVLLCAVFHSAQGIENPGTAINNDVGVFTVLGTKVDLRRQFTDHTGHIGALSEFVTPDAPVLVVPVYYRCPRLCGLVLDGVIALLNELPLLLGKELTVLAVSINPTEKSEEGAEVREKFLARLKLKQGADYGYYRDNVIRIIDLVCVVRSLLA